MVTSVSSHASSLLPCLATSSPRRRRRLPIFQPPPLATSSPRGVLLPGAGGPQNCRWAPRRPSAVAVTSMCFGGRNRPGGGRDFGGELVDENMAVLRKRIHELRMAEEGGDGDGAGPPAHWMEWEKRHHGCYTAAVCDAAAALQRLLLNSRPSVALGVAAVMAVSVPASAIVVVLSLLGCMVR